MIGDNNEQSVGVAAAVEKTLDLSSEQPEKDRSKPPTYNPEEHKNNVRKVVSYWLLGILSGCALFVAIIVIWRPTAQACEGAKEISLLLFTPVLTSVSTILGFYFGEKSNA